jgi:hypothetical protein
MVSLFVNTNFVYSLARFFLMKQEDSLARFMSKTSIVFGYSNYTCKQILGWIYRNTLESIGYMSI